MSLKQKNSKNVLGGELKICSCQPMTGYFRNGHCQTSSMDRGLHVICAEMTQDFLEYTKAKGNDLSTARPEFGFPGLQAGDKWCLCVDRWKEAMLDGCAPPIILEACEQRALLSTPLSTLKKYAIKYDKTNK